MIQTRTELERTIRDAKAFAARLPYSTPSAKAERELIAGVLPVATVVRDQPPPDYAHPKQVRPATSKHTTMATAHEVLKNR